MDRKKSAERKEKVDINSVKDIGELRELKRQIEQKIRDAKNKDLVYYKDAKIDRDVTAVNRPWRISIKRRLNDRSHIRNQMRWVSIIRDTSRERAIEKLSEVIEELTGLKKELEENEHI